MNLAGVIVFSIASASDTRSALQAVYEALGGAGWSDNTNWTSSADPCYWAHVSCSDASEVESLDMSASTVTGLNGTLPDELGEIPTLKTLALFADSNQAHRISGTLPAALSKLSSLIYVYLQSATWPNVAAYPRISGTVPPELGQLGNLTNLDLRLPLAIRTQHALPEPRGPGAHVRLHCCAEQSTTSSPGTSHRSWGSSPS